MGKISDIWVRLGLKKNEFDKGMDDAARKAEGFGGTLGKVKAGALAVWAAIGSSVVAFGKKMIDTTNAIGDRWNLFTAQAKTGWDTFIQSLSAWNWENFIGRFREATQAAKELQNALDAEFEISNSIKLQKAAMAEELNALEILARNSSKPYEVRAKAAQDYLDKVRPLYEQEKELANLLLDAQQGKWLAGTGLSDTDQTRRDLAKFLIDYGKVGENKSLLDALAFIREYTSAQGTRQRNRKSFEEQVALARQYNLNKGIVSGFEQANGYGTSLIELSKAYENLRGDNDTQPLVDALIRAGEAAGMYDSATKRMQMALNTALSGSGAGTGAGGTAEVQTQLADITSAHETAFKLGKEITNDIRLLNEEFAEVGDIDIDLSDVDAEIQAFLDEWKAGVEQVAELNNMLEDSIVSAMSNGLQAIMDMAVGLEGADMKNALAAFIAPFGDMAKNMGAMIMAYGLSMEAFKEAFTNPYVAIAAGAGLMAIGAAISAGANKIASGSAGGGATSAYSGGGSYGSTDLNYESTLTVEVVGRISGSDIIIAGKNQQNKWNR